MKTRRDNAFRHWAKVSAVRANRIARRRVERVVLNTLAKLLRLCRRIFAPSAIDLPSVRAGLAFSGEVDPPYSSPSVAPKAGQRWAGRLNPDGVFPNGLLTCFTRPFACFFQRFAGFQQTFEAGENMRPSGRDGLDELRAFFLHFVNDRELD
jgi:hypothetical protein